MTCTIYILAPIVLMEKVKKEQQLFYRSLFWCFLYDSVGLYTEQLTEIVIRLFGKLFFVVKKVIANAERHLHS